MSVRRDCCELSSITNELNASNLGGSSFRFARRSAKLCDCIALCESHCRALRRKIHIFQANLRVASAVPGAFHGRESARICADQSPLFLPRKREHAVIIARVPQRREDSAADAEIRVSHVRRFRCIRKTQRKFAKARRCHHTSLFATCGLVRHPRLEVGRWMLDIRCLLAKTFGVESAA